MKAVCGGCMDRCGLEEEQTSMCRARKNIGGAVIPIDYGKITSVALDPIEGKPLKRLLPGSAILSVGSFGCDLRYPFCQNHKISIAGEGDFESVTVSPEELTQGAAELGKNGNISAAYTYNGPLVDWEYVRDAGRLTRRAGMKNATVTNESVSDQILDEILPVADTMSIDLKGFTENYYRKLGGSLETVKRSITCASHRYHVELATLVVPRESDSDEEIREMTGWASSLNPEIPLHVTRLSPRQKMDNRPATGATRVYILVQIAREYLGYVWTDSC